MKLSTIIRIALIKLLAGNMAIVLNVSKASFKPKYRGQSMYVEAVDELLEVEI